MNRRLRILNMRLRRGTTTVEAAFVLPVFFFVMFALFEFAHASLILSLLHSGCRSGARLGSTEGVSTGQVEAHVRQRLGSAVSPAAVSVFVRDAQGVDAGSSSVANGADVESLPSLELMDAEDRQLFVVRARVAYNDVALLPMKFMEGVVLDAQAFMRHE